MGMKVKGEGGWAYRTYFPIREIMPWHVHSLTVMHTHKAVCACVCVWRQLRISVWLAAGQVHDRLINLSCAPLFDLFSHTEPLWINADTQNTHLNSAYQEPRRHRACSNTCETGCNFSYTDLIFGDVISQPEILSHFFSAFKHQSLSHTHTQTHTHAEIRAGVKLPMWQTSTWASDMVVSAKVDDTISSGLCVKCYRNWWHHYDRNVTSSVSSPIKHKALSSH